MVQFDVYVETLEDGRIRAHVLSLPGCFAVGSDEAAALTAVSTTITQMTNETAVTVHAAEREGTRPIFTPERQPIGREEIEQLLALAAQNRAELLALVRPLVSAMRRWQAHDPTRLGDDPTKLGDNQMSINGVLLHIASSERWYLSRLLGPLAEPLEMTLHKYLRWSRQEVETAVRGLTDEQLTAVNTQPYQTGAPQEEWSVRKMLRRLLEHEREHIAHIHEILAQWRNHYLARLHAERTDLLWQLRGLSEETVSIAEVMPHWTVKDVLAHIPSYDAAHAGRIQMVLDGRTAELTSLADESGLANRNQTLHEQNKAIPYEQVIAMLLKERSGFQAMLGRVPDVLLHSHLTMPWGRRASDSRPGSTRTSIRVWANWRLQHDEDHGRQLAAWRQTLPREMVRGAAPKYVVRAMLHSTRKAFQALLPLIPQPEWTARPVCGVWTMKDVVGHLTDWEKVAVEGLRPLAAAHLPEFDRSLVDFDAFNNNNAAARAGQSWHEVWADYETTRATLLDLLVQIDSAQLQRTFAAPWGQELSGHLWLLIWAGHEMEHAVDVRAALKLRHWPARLVQHG